MEPCLFSQGGTPHRKKPVVDHHPTSQEGVEDFLSVQGQGI